MLGLLGAGARSSSSGHQRSPNEEEQDKLHFATGTGRVAVKPGAIPGRQDSLQVMATVFQAALRVAQAAQQHSMLRTLQVLKFLVIPSGLQPRRNSHQRSLNSHCQLPQRKTQQLSRPRFFKASVRRLPCCQPVSWLMHPVRSQVMVQFRGSTATLRVGRVLKPFASATLFCKAGSAAEVKESICALCPVLIKRFQPRRSCRDELTPCSSPSRSPVRPELV